MSTDDRAGEAAPVPAGRDGGPVGIRGWLLVPAVGLVLAPFVLTSEIVKLRDYIAYLDPPSDFLRRFLLFDVACALLLLGAALVSGWRFFRKKRTFPETFIMLLALYPALAAISLGVGYTIGLPGGESEIFGLLRKLAMAGVGIPYILFSKRVRNTFVR